MKKEPHTSFIFPWRRAFHRRVDVFLAAVVILSVAVLIYHNVTIRMQSAMPQKKQRADLMLLPESSVPHDTLVKIFQKTPFPVNAPAAEVEKFAEPLLEQALRPTSVVAGSIKEIAPQKIDKVFRQSAFLPQVAVAVESGPPASRMALVQPRVKLLKQVSSPDPVTWPIFPQIPERLEEQTLMIHVNEQGFVDLCQWVERDENKKIPGIENWILSLRYAPGKEQPRGWFTCLVEWKNVVP